MRRVVLDTNCLLACVDCAFAANASFIVSEDRHFDALKEIDFPKINVQRLHQFAQTLQL